MNMIRVYRSTARFHDMESGRLDVLQGSLPHEAPMERELARRLQATNQWLIGKRMGCKGWGMRNSGQQWGLSLRFIRISVS